VLCEENEVRGSCTDPLSFNSQLRHSQALSTSYLAELLAAGLALGKCHAAPRIEQQAPPLLHAQRLHCSEGPAEDQAENPGVPHS